MNRFHPILLSLVTIVAACADPSAPRREAVGALAGDPWGCTTCDTSNSPILGTHDISRFYMGPNGRSAQAVRLVGIRDLAGQTHAVTMQGDALVAIVNGQPRAGLQLEGWELLLQKPDELIPTPVEIFAYQTRTDWVAQLSVHTYSLVYEELDPNNADLTILKNVCPGLSPDQTSVVFLPGETYDPIANVVEPNRTDWVTVACRGHALAKMKLLGYAPADAYGSTPLQRQATLKMLRADYCGTGVSFTKLGQPIAWRDAAGHAPFDGRESVARIEARWGPSGALCLDTPRVVALEVVKDHCVLPPCAASLGFAGADWITFNP